MSVGSLTKRKKEKRCTCAETLTHTHARTHAHTRTHTHKYTHTHTHANTHARMNACAVKNRPDKMYFEHTHTCLLYTSDAADES